MSEFNDFSMSNWSKIPWFFYDFLIFTNFKNLSCNSMIFPWSWNRYEFQWFFKSCGNPEPYTIDVVFTLCYFIDVTMQLPNWLTWWLTFFSAPIQYQNPKLTLRLTSIKLPRFWFCSEESSKINVLGIILSRSRGQYVCLYIYVYIKEKVVIIATITIKRHRLYKKNG